MPVPQSWHASRPKPRRSHLQHPNIVQVHEVGEHEDKPFLSLEFCGGGSLAQKLNGTPLPAREAATLVETLARAMQAAHDQHIIHRDLKPANVLLTAGEPGVSATLVPKITDFGLAKKLDEAGQTAAGAVMGTPSYMAPEQATGETKYVGAAADIYSLGAILYECLDRPAAVQGGDFDRNHASGSERRACRPGATQSQSTAQPRHDLSEVFGKGPSKTLSVGGGSGDGSGPFSERRTN